MKLGIMQPYFFPYLGYFDLINRTDHWIVFDTAQYIRRGWVNRNRILHFNSGWQYITVPLKKHSRKAVIKDIKITANIDWKNRILAQLLHYRKKARYYKETIDLVAESLSEEESHIVHLNIRVMESICRRLGIDFNFELFSEMDLDLEPLSGPGDWALQISKAMGATEYLNPPGGANLFDPVKFAANGITLKIQKFQNMEYDCRRWDFISGLSIIDVLMWNTPEEISAHLNS